MRFSLLSLLLFSLFAGIATAALTRPHWGWSAALSSTVLLGFCAAAVCAWALPMGAAGKHFGIGALLAGGLYSLLGAPQSTWLGSELPTNRAVAWLDHLLTAEEPEAIQVEPTFYELNSGWYGNWTDWRGPSVSPRGRIGHWLWTLLIAILGGAAAVRLSQPVAPPAAAVADATATSNHPQPDDP